MKEVTEWNKPRWMWCWDSCEEHKVKRYVVCVLTEEEMRECDTSYPVRTKINCYKHCAEIEEETTRLTNYELSQLLKCLGVEKTQNKCHDEIKIRYKQGEWEEPTRETVWKWWGEETPDSDIVKFVSFIGWDKE